MLRTVPLRYERRFGVTFPATHDRNRANHNPQVSQETISDTSRIASQEYSIRWTAEASRLLKV